MLLSFECNISHDMKISSNGDIEITFSMFSVPLWSFLLRIWKSDAISDRDASLVIFCSALIAAEPNCWTASCLMRAGFNCLMASRCLVGSRRATPSGRSSDGEIRTAGEKQGFLMSTTRWGDYELHAEFKTASDGTNSGVFLRTPLEPKNPAGDCYELNIAPPDNPFPTASLVGRQKAALSKDNVSGRRPMALV